MIVDITGTVLTPGNYGKECLGNGFNEGYACCCDECDFLLCCISDNWEQACVVCKDKDCIRNFKNRKLY